MGPIALGGLMIVLGLLATVESVLDKDLAGRPLKMFGRVLIALGTILVIAGLIARLI